MNNLFSVRLRILNAKAPRESFVATHPLEVARILLHFMVFSQPTSVITYTLPNTLPIFAEVRRYIPDASFAQIGRCTVSNSLRS